MLQISWIDLAAIGAILAIVTTLVVAAMKSKFPTWEQHAEYCGKNTMPIKEELTAIRSQIAEIEQKRNEAMRQRNRENLWLVQAIRRIADKVGAEINDMPS